MAEENKTDLFDLLGAKYKQTQHTLEMSWNENSDIPLTNSEWFILDRINDQVELLADVCKNGEITRQGTHKLVRKLEDRGLLTTKRLEHNKRNKYVQLTLLGLACYEENKKMKQALEAQIKQTLGLAPYEQLKKLLAADWKL